MSDPKPATSPSSPPSSENGSSGGAEPPARLTRADASSGPGQGGPEAPRGAPSSSPSGGQDGASERAPGTGDGAPSPPPGSELIAPAAAIANAAFGQWDLDKLTDAIAGNPRKYPEKKVRALAMAIETFGFRVPLLVRFSTGEIVDGHRRKRACLWLRENKPAVFERRGLQRLPVYNADDMSDAEVRAFRLSVNRQAETGEWDEDATVVEVEAAKDAGFELGVDGAIGFDLEDVDAELSPQEWDFTPTHDVFVATITGSLPFEADLRDALRAFLASHAGVKIEFSSIKQS